MAPELPAAMTGDNEPFDLNKNYFYFDQQSNEIQQTKGMSLRQIDEIWLGSMGYKIVQFGKLHANRVDSACDGQRFYESEITKMQTNIEQLKLEKI